MTPEQKQQLAEVVIHRDESLGATKTGVSRAALLNTIKTLRVDIDFLLSLVKSQEASNRNPVGWISCGLRHGHDRIVDIVFENATCAKDFIDGVEPVTGPIIAAEQMRSACVEKARERARAHRRIASAINYGEVVDVPVPAEQHCKLADELDAVAKELESVSIQEQKS